MSALPQHPTASFAPAAFPQPKASSFTRAYEVDVFLSYGHIDNREDWVTDFHSYLQRRLQQLLGTDDVIVWRDPWLGGTNILQEVLREKVSRSALFISVLSPRYVTSPSCRDELDWFVAAAQQTGGLRVETDSRLIRVVKTKLPEEVMEPANFKATLGYEFYESDPQNPSIFWEFSSKSGMPRYAQFYERCEVLAQTVTAMLLKMKRMTMRYPEADKRRTIFLARTTSDLESRRASIQSELTGRGHAVLPTEPLPDTGPEMRAAVQALLEKADISVHLIGPAYGGIPERETKSFGELQYELAFARRGRLGFHHLLWIPADLQKPEERQQMFLARVHSSIDESSRSDVFETSFESFKEGLLDVLSRKPEPAPPSVPPKGSRVYLLCDQPDLRREPLAKIKAYLRSRGHPVELPPFQGEPEELRELEEELIGDTDAALIYYGTAKDAWILRKRRNLLKVLSKKATGRGYARSLYLCTPKDESKKDYLEVPGRHYLENPAFPPLLVLGDCEDFEPKKLDEFLELIEKDA